MRLFKSDSGKAEEEGQSEGAGRGREQKFHSPDLGAAVLEKLEEFGDHDVERSVQSIAVQ